jgi:hypothetical protein
MPTRRRHRALQYRDPHTYEGLADENGQRLRWLYRRYFGRDPAFESSSTDPLVREHELQAVMLDEICRKLLAEQPEFHNEPGRPEGSKNAIPRPLRSGSKDAERKRRQRAKEKRDN